MIPPQWIRYRHYSFVCVFLLCLGAALLLLVLDQLNVGLGDFTAVHLHEPLLDVVTDVALDGNLLGPGGGPGHGGAGGELLAELFGQLLVLQAKDLQAGDDRDVLAFVAFDPFDDDLGGGLALGIASFDLGGLGFLLRGVLGGPFLGGNGERGEVGGYRICRSTMSVISCR